ncbi:MAG TPA: hypothetical protein VIN07_09705, partial [Flavipsychrobacter sp.]
STINMGLHMAGVYASTSKLMKKSSIEASANYTNLTPFYGIAKTNFDFYDVPKGAGGSAKYTYRPNENGIFKVLVNYQQFQNGTRLPNPEDASQTLDFGLKNSNVYSVVSYRQTWKSKWGLYAAGMYSYNQDDIKFNTTPLVNKDDRSQMRLEGKYFGGTKVSVLLGTEIQRYSYDWTFGAFEETQIAGYLETEWSPLYWLAIKPGVRYEHSMLIGNNAVSPRLAAAIRAGLHGQFSVASGMFYQLAEPQYYMSGHRPGFQQSIHYIANYQYMHNDRTLRLEAYYKDYNQLVREHYPPGTPFDPNTFRYIPRTILVNNAGYGYAQGLELFWRDKKTVKNGDYWISYSYIDTRRLYKNYLASVQPDFIATHNLNIVTKYFIPKWATQVNATYNYSSGRPYYNPSATEFMSERTPAFHNLSITINYLRSFGKWFSVIYAGVDNVTNQKNIFGYRYANGVKTPVIPPIYRSVFVGVNFSLTAFDVDEL